MSYRYEPTKWTGVALTPVTPIGEVIQSSATVNAATAATSGVNAPGITIHLGEGAWSFSAAGLSINRSNVRIVGQGRRTVLYRTVTATAPLVTVTGRNVWFEHLRIIDSASAFPAFSVTGDGFALTSVVGEDVFRLLTATGVNNLHLCGVDVESASDTDYSVEVAGTSADTRITSCRFAQTGQTAAVYVGDSASYVVASGNIFRSPISYLGAGVGMAISANANGGTVTAR